VRAEANVAGQSQANPGTEPSRFTDDLQPLFGDDPDPLFLEESWTLGVPAAVESLHRRRQNREQRERQSRAFRELDSIAALNFVPAEPTDIGSFLADRAATIASHYDSARSRRAPAAQPSQAAAARSWTPQDWTPEDRNRQRWIPQGWLPEDVVRHLEAAQQPETALRPASMELAHACELLGVLADSTPTEIRSAYRRMVVECHPDRHQGASDAVRQDATERMTELNEAYRLLRTARLENAA
jgi:hypothetical protein